VKERLGLFVLDIVTYEIKRPHNQEAACGVRVKGFSCGHKYDLQRMSQKNHPSKSGLSRKNCFLLLNYGWNDEEQCAIFDTGLYNKK
jgi:hypothetical protein